MFIQQSLSEKVNELFTLQMDEWPLLKSNYLALEQVITKNLDFPDYFVKVQYNPARMKSSAAKVDKASIQGRPCFLCDKNMPVEQKGIPILENYQILINPYPIFPRHLTISAIDHVPQLILDKFGNMLEIARELTDYTIFYNGPRCGASAPDHFHFQAGNRGFMPLDNQMAELLSLYGKAIGQDSIIAWKVDDMIRKFIVIESSNAEKIESVFQKIYNRLLMINPHINEPDVNLHCQYANGKWKVIIFPRGAHRPWQYYAEGRERILFSPASVDLGGLLIIPLEEDFSRLDKIQAWSMLKQVCISKEEFDKIEL